MPVGSSKVFEIPEYSNYNISRFHVQQQIPEYKIHQQIQSVANNKPAPKGWDYLPELIPLDEQPQPNEQENQAFEKEYNSMMYGQNKQVLNQD